MGEVRSQGACDKSKQSAALRRDVAGPCEFHCFPHGAGNTQRAYIMLMSAIDSAGQGRTTEDIFSPRSPPPPSSSHQYAPRSRGSHHAIFAPCLWPVLWSANTSRPILCHILLELAQRSSLKLLFEGVRIFPLDCHRIFSMWILRTSSSLSAWLICLSDCIK